MADELERKHVDRLRVDRDEDDAADTPEVEAHAAEAERLMRDEDRDAEPTTAASAAGNRATRDLFRGRQQPPPDYALSTSSSAASKRRPASRRSPSSSSSADATRATAATSPPAPSSADLPAGRGAGGRARSRPGSRTSRAGPSRPG